jgi:arginine repressor
MKNESKIPHATREDVRDGIRELFAEQEEGFKGQPEIVAALKEKGINTPQVMVSRVLAELKIKRNENGFWALSEKDGFQQELEILEELFKKTGGSPRLYSNIETVILRTKPNYNVLFSQQIADTFEDEVISTFCPNETDIVIYYKRRKKDFSTVEDENSNQTASEDLYRKSRMRIEIVKLCKKTREENEEEN